MRYLRFVIHQKDPSSGVREGLFQVAGRLAKAGTLSANEQQRLDGLRSWFGTHLPKPDGFTRTRNAAHKNTRGIAWFKDSANAHLRKMRDLVAFLEEHGIAVETIETDRPGYLVYEDDFQVIAEPFAETRV
jgi:hypothetical protein